MRVPRPNGFKFGSIQSSSVQFSSGGMEGRAGALADRRPEGSRARTRACGGGDLQSTPYILRTCSCRSLKHWSGAVAATNYYRVSDTGLRVSTRIDLSRCAGPCLLLALLTVTLGNQTPTLGTCLIAGPWRSWMVVLDSCTNPARHAGTIRV